jgi:hypothetical protein
LSDYEERQQRAVTLPAELVRQLWATIKGLRDDFANLRLEAERSEKELNALLVHMHAIGMADHLPTIEEVQAAWRGQEEANPIDQGPPPTP